MTSVIPRPVPNPDCCKSKLKMKHQRSGTRLSRTEPVPIASTKKQSRRLPCAERPALREEHHQLLPAYISQRISNPVHYLTEVGRLPPRPVVFDLRLDAFGALRFARLYGYANGGGV